MSEDQPTVAVVGAGLSGLTAAYRLHNAGWRVTVLESDDCIGGRVRSVERDGYILDTGATGLAESYDAYLSLVAELGLRDEIVPASPAIGIYRDGRIHHLRLDRIVRSGLQTKLLSPAAKLRAVALVYHVGRAKLRRQLDYNDMRNAAPLDLESAREFSVRVLGSELSEYLSEPVVRMMLIADGDQVSVVELFSGLANIFSSRICSLRGGQGRLPQLLAQPLDVRLSSPVEQVTDCADHVEVTWLETGVTRSRGQFDACVISAPLPVAAEICPDRSSVLGPLNQALGYTQCLSVAVATSVQPVTPALVVQLPPREDPTVALMFLNHNKSSDRTPPGRGLIECCWEDRASRASFEADDEEIAARTLRSVLRVFPELHDQIEFTHVTRWARALPHTRIGSYKLIGELNARIDPNSRIQFAADYMSAAGQNTAVAFGTRAARALIDARSRGAMNAAIRAPLPIS
ncbi:MAG: protoporphyrinogen/coproporphyrinogen oxidase [Solirubrobacteraceae bacterium]